MRRNIVHVLVHMYSRSVLLFILHHGKCNTDDVTPQPVVASSFGILLFIFDFRTVRNSLRLRVHVSDTNPIMIIYYIITLVVYTEHTNTAWISL